MGKSLATLASELGIPVATAEVYAIDCLAAGRQIAHEQIASYLAISTDTFQRIKASRMKTTGFEQYVMHSTRNFPTIKSVLSWRV